MEGDDVWTDDTIIDSEVEPVTEEDCVGTIIDETRRLELELELDLRGAVELDTDEEDIERVSEETAELGIVEDEIGILAVDAAELEKD